MKLIPGTHLDAGQSLGHYQLVQRLDQGHRAEVWLAQHVNLQVPVVLKILLQAGRSAEAYQRDGRFLQNEAQVLAGLHHHYIVGYRDYIEGRNFRALAMEYAPRGSVVHFHGAGRKLSLFLIRLYVSQIGRALHTLHRRGQIHRDVKPGNILLLNQHHALLADFGLAIDDPVGIYPQKRYTGGTAPYMAPEQYRGEPCAASDQYSLAISVYEWLTGHRPFSSGMTRDGHRRERAIPRSVRIERPELPIAVDKIIWTALHPDPAQRYPGILDFAREFVGVTRVARPPLMRRLPYYRGTHFRHIASFDDEITSAPVPLQETGEQCIVRAPLLSPAECARFIG